MNQETFDYIRLLEKRNKEQADRLINAEKEYRKLLKKYKELENKLISK